MFFRLSLLLICAGLSLAARADILVGSYDTPSSMRAFADTADGDVAPIRILGGAATGLSSASGGAFDPGEGVIYLADFWGQAIRVFPAYAGGNVAPLRQLTTNQLGQMRTVSIDPAHNELITTGSGCCLLVFPRTASGDDFALRRWAWGGNSQTELNYPTGFVYASVRDEILVSDYDNNGPKILVFNRDEGTVSYDGAPKRVIRGNLTGMGNFSGGITYDATSDLIYVLTTTTNPDTTRSSRVLVFAGDAGGNVAPVRTIAGAATQLELSASAYPVGLAIDPVRQRLIVSVSDDGQPTNTALLVFALNANGNTAPLQAIRGAQTGLASVGLPIWVPADAIFENGFD